MRELQLSVPREQRPRVLGVLEERGVAYVVADGDGARDGHDLVSFVVPADAVEHVLDDLAEVGYDRRVYTVSTSTEFAIYEGVDDVQDTWADTPNSISPETLRSKAKDMRPNTRSYVWMMLLSTVVASSGLLVGSPAIVVGSMVLAPLVAPMLTASIGVVRDDRDMLLDSLGQQALGLGVAVVGAVVFSFAVKALHVYPATLNVASVELLSVRLSPGVLSVPIGLAAGAAGAFGLATKGNVSIVGVMVAAALVPTAATAGIGFAWGAPVVGVGSLLLLLLTIVAVNTGSSLMFSYLDYRPDEVDEGIFDLSSTREAAVLGGTALVVLVVVALVLVGAVQHIAFEFAVNRATEDVLAQGEYTDLDLVGLTVEYAGWDPLGEGTTVTATMSRVSDQSYPALANTLDRAVTERTDQPVTVQVQFRDYEVSNATAG